ncbi:MAG: putative metal-dependent hydrolase [Acidobacteriota bacterium]|nr:putative metal-dependent hydrolase [Acidobacteriota bacterium]
MNVSDNLRYPIGEFVAPAEVSRELRARCVEQLAELPRLLRRAVAGLTPEQLSTPYRPDGWTVRQVVHHLPDSHLNGYTRIKLALTEVLPVIKTYDQDAWVSITDLRTPVEASLRLLEGLHEHWAALLRALSEEQWQRGFIHPELARRPTTEEAAKDQTWQRLFAADERGRITVERILPTYAWHGRHHTAQITSLRTRMGWN